ISTHPKTSPASAWTGTHVLFEITERGNTAILDFRHSGWMKAVNISDSATISGAWRCKSFNNGVNHINCAANPALHRIAVRLRFCLKLKVYGGAARGELLR